jgi:hypothetical protein
MIVNFIDNICDAMHFICNPFPIDFCCATKSIPVCGDRNAASHSIKIQEVLCALGSIKAYFTAHAMSTLPSGNHAAHESPATTSLVGKPSHITFGFGRRWVPPSKSADDTNDYVHHVLGDMGYL